MNGLCFFFKKSFAEWKKVCTFAPAFKGRESLEIVKSDAEIAQLVEHDLAKVGVASSSLVFRSKVTSQSGRNKRSGGGMVDTRDLKSLARKGVWVQVPPGVQQKRVI